MEKDGLPQYTPVDEHVLSWRRQRLRRRVVKLAFLILLTVTIYNAWRQPYTVLKKADDILLDVQKLRDDYAVCSKLRTVPKASSSARERSARYIEGHKPALIRNATVWTGEPADGTSSEDARLGKGYSWINADVFIEHGMIKRVGSEIEPADLPADCTVYDAAGRLLTSGIVDMHSHTGVDSLPDLRGNSDTNELSSDITPYVRSIDGLNPLDHQIQVIKSGGVTTSLILPGSGNNMGGEAYIIKHAVGKPDGRSEISAEDMLADPERTWRYMKMACGENPKRVYGRLGRSFGPFSRLGEAWYFRHAFEQAKAMVQSQDDWCTAADEVGVENMQTYLPQELQWESLGALLRGQVLLNTHCYTIPDLEAFVRHTNEFKFEVQAFHHAHQTYLVPEILKRAYGGKPPAAALFADNMYYKAESYVASEQAGKILWENGITPVYVSDNPVLNAQHVVFEAAKAYKNGLPYHVALAGVTSASAEILGLGDKIGKVKAGYDADVVVWDSDPLSVGATPVQVWIDGVPQFENPLELKKPADKPMKQVDLPINEQEEIREEVKMIFEGVSKVLLPGLERTFDTGNATVVFSSGSIVCAGDCTNEQAAAITSGARTVLLNKGYVVPPATAFGSSLGLEEIQAEADTVDGFLPDGAISRAIDGLSLSTKSLHAAYSHGVTRAITAPRFRYGGFQGVSAGFRTGAGHTLEEGAILQDEVALHYTLTKSQAAPALSDVIGQLHAKLLKATDSNATFAEESWLSLVVSGRMPLVVTVHSADMIAALLRVKAEVESALQAHTSSKLRLIIHGGAESWMLAKELAQADVPVVLAPLLPYAESK